MSSIHASVLGRGLGSLIPASKTAVAAKDGTPLFVAIDKVKPMVDQPRQYFDDRALRQLALSIREQGVLQPLLVSPEGNGTYALIAGERRLRASELAGLTEVPVVVRQLGPTESFEVALIENIQRQDLNPLEEALSFERLISEHGYTQDALAKRVGKDRSTITNALRLLKLPAELRAMIVRGSLSAGHARALLSSEDEAFQVELAARIEDEGLSVRTCEKLVQERKDAKNKKERDKPQSDPFAAERAKWTNAFSAALGQPVAIRAKGEGLIVSIPVKDAKELAALLARLPKAG